MSGLDEIEEDRSGRNREVDYQFFGSIGDDPNRFETETVFQLTRKNILPEDAGIDTNADGADVPGLLQIGDDRSARDAKHFGNLLLAQPLPVIQPGSLVDELSNR